MIFARILVAIDSSEQSDSALRLAARLAADQGAQLTIATVVGWSAERYAPPDVIVDPTIDEHVSHDAEEFLRSSADTAKSLGANATVCLHQGPVVEEILACIEEHRADLLVLGTHARSGLSRVVEGSIAEALLRASHTPVLVART